MSRGSSALLALAFSGALLAGCATNPDEIWPSGAPPWISLRYQGPSAPMTPQAAIGAIKNLQTQFCTWDGNTISQLDVDSFGIRARAQWVETSTHSQYVPTWGGFFVGNSYVPTYGGSTQTSTTQTPREEMVVVPFNKVTNIEVFQYPALPRDNKFGVAVSLEGGARQPATVFGWLIGAGESVVLRFTTEAAATEFADAVTVLLQAQGKVFNPPKRDVSMYLRDLSAEQRENLAEAGINGGGAVVVSVGRGGPAAAAGLQVGDVILSVEGKPVASGAQVFAAIDAVPGETVNLQGARRGMVSDGKGKQAPGWIHPTFTVQRAAAAAPAPVPPPAPAGGAQPGPAEPTPLSRGMIGTDIGPVSPVAAQELAAMGVGGGTEVRGVTAGGPADGAKIQAGDVLLSVDGKPAPGPEQFKALIGSAGASVSIRGFRRGQVPDSSGKMVPGWTPVSFTLTRHGM